MGKKNRKSRKSTTREPATRIRSGGVDWQAWYLAESRRGEQLLVGGQANQARVVFESILARLSETPSYARAVILGRLGRCFLMGGQAKPALVYSRQAMAITDQLAPGDDVQGLRGMLHAELGDALRTIGQYAEARQNYETALRIATDLNDLRGQGVDLGQLGALALAEGRLEEAMSRYQASLELLQQLPEPTLAAIAWQQLGSILQRQGEWEEAERHYREAARIREGLGNLAGAAQTWSQLAELLQDLPGRLAEARQLAEEAMAIARALNPMSPEAWRLYGVLANLDDREAADAADGQRRSLLQARADDYRQLQRHAPGILAALARLDDTPSFARAVVLGRLGRCLLIGGQADLALAHLRQAISITAQLAPGEDARDLHAMLHADLGDTLRAIGRPDEARQAHETALKIAAEPNEFQQQDLDPDQPWLPTPEVTVHEERITEYILEPDLLLDGRRVRRILPPTDEPEPLADNLRPMLSPCTRTHPDEQGAVRFLLPPEEPILERHPGCIVMRRIRREVSLARNDNLGWCLIRLLDGVRTIAEILRELPARDHASAERLLATLAAIGAIDVSGRPLARSLHAITKKGVLPGGGLAGEEILQLATDGRYRTYPETPRIAVGLSVPERLRGFHALTRARRSRRDYRGLPVDRADFDALLHTACGVTGSLAGAGREAKLRAYPSSGALYAVEIYPVVLRVEGLKPAIYHYRVVDNQLEVVRPDIDPAQLLAAALPVERGMVGGAAAMICLTGYFPRHERKYGEGGYRMLVAEAGHVSQNLVLAATALGLSARPFGGVFDELLNQDLGLDQTQEQFLLAILVGHAGDTGMR